jgi:hypothetical protein
LDYYFYDITIEPLLGNRHTESNNDSWSSVSSKKNF